MWLSARSPMRSWSSCSTKRAPEGAPRRMRNPPHEIDFTSALGRQIVELHVWAVSQGLRGAAADRLFDGFCQRLVIAGVPLWPGYAALQTLHPQWAGYSYTWRRDLNAIEPEQLERGEEYEQSILTSPFYLLITEARAARDGMSWRHLGRRLAGPAAQRDFAILERLAAAGATDYFAEIVHFGTGFDASRGTGIGYSFASDRPEGFGD